MPPPSWVPSGENCPVNFLKNSRELRAAEVQEPDGWGSRPTGSPARVSALKSYCWGSNLISKTFFSTRVHPFPVTRSIRPLALTLRCRFLAGWSNFAFDKRNTVFYSCVDETQDQETETEEHGKQLAYDR